LCILHAPCRPTGGQGPTGPNGNDGDPGCGFNIDYVGPVDNLFFLQPNPPWLDECAIGCTYFAVVTDDNRGNQSVPANLNGDVSAHLIQYDCVSGLWIDVGQFLALPGPTGPTGKV
jgi:hypothetical protein